jgi:hypothetical protein
MKLTELGCCGAREGPKRVEKKTIAADTQKQGHIVSGPRFEENSDDMEARKVSSEVN